MHHVGCVAYRDWTYIYVLLHCYMHVCLAVSYSCFIRVIQPGLFLKFSLGIIVCPFSLILMVMISGIVSIAERGWDSSFEAKLLKYWGIF